MVDDDWNDLSSAATRFRTKDATHERGARTLGIETWTDKEKENVPARMVAAQEDLDFYKLHKQKMKANPRSSQVIEATDRRTMEEAYLERTKEKCPLKHQGSKHFLGKMNKAASEGRVEHVNNTEIVPYVPHPDTKTRAEKRVSGDGIHEDF
jgi:hypothetical protein